MHFLEDNAFVFDVRPYGERTMLLSMFSKTHGLLRVMWKGEDRQRPRIGQAVWIALQKKHQGHLGEATIELLSDWGHEGHAGQLQQMQELHAVFALLLRVLPTGHAYPDLYAALGTLRTIKTPTRFQEALVAFYFLLLQSLGYALPLQALAQRGEGPDVPILKLLQGWQPTAELTLPVACDQTMHDKVRTFVTRYVQRFLLEVA